MQTRKDIRELTTVLRTLWKQNPPPAPTAPEGAATEVQALRRELDFRDSLAEAGVTDPKQRKLLDRLWKAEQPQDVVPWITETLAQLGKPPTAPATVAPTVPPVTPTAPSNTGAPTVTTRSVVPETPSALTPEMIRSMSESDIQAHYAHWRARHAINANPLAAKRLAREQPANALLAQIQQAIQAGGKKGQ